MGIKEENLSKIAVKNSAYVFTTIFVSKIGSLIFTILIARLLLPELFGIYGIVLSIVMIAMTISNLGIDQTATRYVSHAFGKNNIGKARSYFRYLLKIKSLLVLLIIIILLIFSKFLAYNIFNKPAIFFPIIFSSLYILMESLRSLFGILFLSTKDVKPLPFLEAVLQISKVLIAVLLIYILSNELRVAGIFIAFAISSFLFLILSIIILIKKEKKIFYGKNVKIEKIRIKKYLTYMGIAGLSLVFFGSIDTLMLGIFVDAVYIGYYRAALGLILTISALLSFSGVLLPIFTQISGDRLERGFKKTFRYILIFTIPASVGIVLIAKYFIFAVYGSEYLPATRLMYALSFLIITGPLIALYSIVFEAKEKVKTLAKSIYIALSINFLLNLIFILWLLKISQEHVILGVSFATLISRGVLLGILVRTTKKKFKLKIDNQDIFKPLFATFIMAIFLISFNIVINVNLFFGFLEIILGAAVYFAVMWSINGIKLEDIKLLKLIIK